MRLNCNYPNNYLKFPDNVLEPKKIEVFDTSYTLYGFKFKGLNDLYDFLIQKPKINRVVWDDDEKISSLDSDQDFHGVPYPEALEKLVQQNDPGYKEYLKIQKNIIGRSIKIHKYKDVKSIAGGVVDPVLYTTGSPLIYNTSRLVSKPNFITIDIQVAYRCCTSINQVFNRAIIITNLIKALERNGYSVNVNSFMLAYKNDEIIQAVFEIKQHGQQANYQALYKSLVDVEFFRRICFRLMEITDVRRNWPDGYGFTCEEDMARKILHLTKDDIYFDQPHEMGIYGDDIAKDFEKTILGLKLEDHIDLSKEKEIIKQSVKVLKR